MAAEYPDKNRLSHAIILSAATDESMERKARNIAAAAVCLQEQNVPCGICRACRKVQNGTHPDVITIERLTDKSGKPKRDITVDQIRDLSLDAVVLPNEADHKVYIIREADLMNLSAQNAALKLFEEPPKGVIFVLCAKNPSLLLETVHSRCSEITLGGTDADIDSGIAEYAASYLQLATRRNMTDVFSFFAEREKMDTRTAAEFFTAVRMQIADILSGREDNPGLSIQKLLYISKLYEKCSEYNKVNVGVKHMMGFLASETIEMIEGKN